MFPKKVYCLSVLPKWQNHLSLYPNANETQKVNWLWFFKCGNHGFVLLIAVFETQQIYNYVRKIVF